ncbi:MAG: hypothetical protein AAFX86_13470 [Pseudomonadota bacterium]
MLKKHLTALAVALALMGASEAQEERGTFGIELGTGKIICTGDGDGQGEGVQPLDESYARSAAWDRMMFGEENQCAPAPVVVEFTEIDEGTWARTQIFTGVDTEGRRADMRIYVLDDRFSWVFGSSQDIEEGDRPARFSYIFGRPMFLGEFCEGDAAVAVGAASFEGDAELNRRLASNRANTIGVQMTRLAGFCGEQTPPDLYKVNLGEFTSVTDCMRAGTCTGRATSPQRRVVIIGVASAEPGVNLSQAVRNGLGTPVASDVVAASDYAVYEFDGL